MIANVIALFVAVLHRVETGLRKRVGSFELLLDQKIPFRQVPKRRSVFVQVWAGEAQHFPRSHQILSECTQR